MSLKPFFIVGLPRTRTAWLANLLTWNDSFCFHEALVQCASMKDLRNLFERRVPRMTRHVGDADPSLGLVAQSVLDEFPGCRVVSVFRDMEDAVVSYYNATLVDGSSEYENLNQDQIHKVCQETAKGIAHLLRSLPFERRMTVLYSDLDRPATIQAIWRFCLPNTPFPQERYELLENLRVTQIFSKVLRKHPGRPFMKLIKDNLFKAVKNERVLANKTVNA